MKVMPSQEQIGKSLESLRTKILIGQGSEIHNDVVEWVRSIEYRYGTQEGETVSRPSIIGKPYKAQVKRMESFPAKLMKLKEFIMFDRQIPKDEIQAAVITVYPPPRDSSGYENIVESSLMVARNRFIYVIGSDELVEYSVQNPEELAKSMGMSSKTHGLMEIVEHVERGYAYHFDQASAVSINWKFNDLNFFRKTVKNGMGSREVSLEKRIKGRYILVVDLLMDSKKFKSTIKDTVSFIGDISKDESIPAPIRSKVSQISEIAKEEDVEDVEIPELTDILNSSASDVQLGESLKSEAQPAIEATPPSHETTSEMTETAAQLEEPQKHEPTEYDDVFATV